RMDELLTEHLAPARAGAATTGWRGDAFATVRCSGALGFVDRWQADDGPGAARLADALREWSAGWSGSLRLPAGDGRFAGPSGVGRIVVNGTAVDLVLGDDRPTVD